MNGLTIPFGGTSDGTTYTLNGAGLTLTTVQPPQITLQAQGIHLDALRVRAFPFAQQVLDFAAAHDQIFVVEQNRDAQLRSLLVNEGGIDPAKLTAVLHYDGTPITERFISRAIAERLRALNVTPLRKTV